MILLLQENWTRYTISIIFYYFYFFHLLLVSFFWFESSHDISQLELNEIKLDLTFLFVYNLSYFMEAFGFSCAIHACFCCGFFWENHFWRIEHKSDFLCLYFDLNVSFFSWFESLKWVYWIFSQKKTFCDIIWTSFWENRRFLLNF